MITTMVRRAFSHLACAPARVPLSVALALCTSALTSCSDGPSAAEFVPPPDSSWDDGAPGGGGSGANDGGHGLDANPSTDGSKQDVSPDSPADAGPVPDATSDGGSTWVDPGPAGPEIRMVYIYPTDRPLNPAYEDAIEHAGRNIQTWYKDQLGNGETFRLRNPVVEVHASSHTASWFSTHPTSGGALLQWAENARDDAMALTGAIYDDPSNAWIFYLDSDNACGQYGGTGGNHVAAMPANDLRGLAGIPGVKTCPEDPDWWYTFPPCRWVGGLAHELGHAFGLPHPPGCEAGDPGCDANALMWEGYASYPATYLRNDEKAILDGATFFAVRDSLPMTDCNKL